MQVPKLIISHETRVNLWRYTSFVKRLNWRRLLFSILLCESAGIVGSVFTVSSIPTWYATLEKPSFSPPNWVFGPVWIALYTLMGVALYLVWMKELKKKEYRRTIAIFAIQLTLNALWPIVFFGGHSILGGFVVITALWISIALTIVHFWKISRTAGLLLLPYLAWVSFAMILNVALLGLNEWL